MQSYKELIVWQKSIQLVTSIYRLTDQFPKKEIFSLVDQICRCSVSIPSNIAEGYHRLTTKEYVHFLHISYGSSAELETQIYIAKNLSYISEPQFDKAVRDIQEIQKMLNAMIHKLKK